MPGVHGSSQPLWRVSTVAQQYSISDRTLRRMIATGLLRVVRPPGLRVVLVPDAEVRRLFRSRPARAKAKLLPHNCC